MAHFTGDHLSAREMEISPQLTRIKWIKTGGGTQQDVGALLMETTLVKRKRHVEAAWTGSRQIFKVVPTKK